MITDGRFCLRMQDSQDLWRYDTKWRKKAMFSMDKDKELIVIEGTLALLVVATDKQTTAKQTVTATVHLPDNPETPVAQGVYADGWTFAGSKEAWALVPDYFVLPGDVPQLLRIADGAAPLELTGLGNVNSAVNVPDSRLLVLLGGGSLSVLDPVSGRSSAKMRLGQGTQRPIARFRTGKDGLELWLNDGCLLMKLETKNWHVVDAAGTEDESPIETWAFVDDRHVVVAPRGKAELLLIDLDEMALVESYFPETRIVDVAAIDESHVVGVDSDGNAWKTKLATN